MHAGSSEWWHFPPFKFGSPELFFTFELFINEALYNFYALALSVTGLP